MCYFVLFSSRRRHTRLQGDWSSDVCSSDLTLSSTEVFGVRVRPKTSVELSVQALDITYDHPRASGLSLDSREYRYLLGVVWEATGKTTGSMRVGGITKKFDDPALPNYSAPNWEVAIRC